MLRRFAVLVALGALGLLTWQILTWPDVAKLARENPETSAFLERHRRASGSEPDWKWTSYDAIANPLKHAVLVAEDINFFSHDGFDLDEMETAVRQALEEGKSLRGASTITQQLAKNLWLSPSRNPWRKIKEVLLTRQLERHLPKRRILELYLNLAQFGPDVFGAEAASRRFFKRPASRLSEHQAAMLAAGLSRPSRWNPPSTSSGYQRRVELIRRRMQRSGWIQGEL